jgi:hypothetical protein
VQVQEKEEAAEIGLEIPVLLPGFMLYMEAVNDFVKPDIVETKESKSPSSRVPFQRDNSANYTRKSLGFRGRNKDRGYDFSHFASQAGADKARVPVGKTRNSKLTHIEERSLTKFRTFLSDICCELCNPSGQRTRNC